MNEFAEIVSRIIREGTLGDPSQAGPLPPASPDPEDQARFESLLNQEPAGPAGPEQVQPVQPGPEQIAAAGGPDFPPPAGLSGDGILGSLARMSSPPAAGLPPVGALDSPESLINFQSYLTRGTTVLDLVGEARSRAEDGIDLLTRG